MPKQPPEYVSVNLDRETIEKHGAMVLQLLNHLQLHEGLTVDEALMIVCITVGVALKQRGVVLDLQGSVEQQLPPVADGYRRAVWDVAKIVTVAPSGNA